MKREIASAALAMFVAAVGVCAGTPKPPAVAAPQAFPDTVVIRSLGAWYGPVEFSHGPHASMAGDCASCHHQSDGEPVACSTCHPAQVDPSDPSTLTLKVAYHGRCLSCHKTSGSGPTGCTDCHAKLPKETAEAKN